MRHMQLARRSLAVLGLVGLTTAAAGAEPKPSIVLVHGAFADGSSWARVIPLLERDGSTVIAVQNGLASLSEERFLAKRMRATTMEIKSSHVPFLSHPKEVATLILQAATATAAGRTAAAGSQ